jgi:hypothetical protein
MTPAFNPISKVAAGILPAVVPGFPARRRKLCNCGGLWFLKRRKLITGRPDQGIDGIPLRRSGSNFVFRSALVRFGAVRCFVCADHPWWFLPRGLGFCRLMVGIFSVLIFTLNNYCSAKVNFGKSPAAGSLVIIWPSLRFR